MTSLGFNSKVQLGDGLYHVQTEDRGLNHPFIDTVVLSQGQVLHRRSSNYNDLLVFGEADQEVLRARVEQQHREVLEALQGGSLPLEKVAAAEVAALEVRLCNAATWLVAGKASLEIQVHARADGRPLVGAEVEVSIEGTVAGSATFSALTDADGRAAVSFQMPKITEPETATLLIRARLGQMRDQVRYRLKSKQNDSTPFSK